MVVVVVEVVGRGAECCCCCCRMGTGCGRWRDGGSRSDGPPFAVVVGAVPGAPPPDEWQKTGDAELGLRSLMGMES